MPLMPQQKGRAPAFAAPKAPAKQPAPPKVEALEIGDFLPPIGVPALQGGVFPLNDKALAGRPSLLLAFAGAADAAACAAFVAAAGPLVSEGGGAAIVVGAPVEQAGSGWDAAAAEAAGIIVLVDPQGVVRKLLHDDPGAPFALARFDMNQRLLAADVGAQVDATAMAAALKPLLEGPAQPGAMATVQAPVLIIPDVFPRAFCVELIEAWEAADNKFVDGAGGAAVNPNSDGRALKGSSVKRRSDWPLTPGPINDRVQRYLNRRVVPEVQKAFGFRAGSYETAKIGCYESERGGWFRRHRDNIGKGTERRVFALSLNLNAEEYDGGEVWFPECGPQKFSPPTGGAAVFSCSLLHEALPVTRGRRFVLLTFLQPPG